MILKKLMTKVCLQLLYHPLGNVLLVQKLLKTTVITPSRKLLSAVNSKLVMIFQNFQRVHYLNLFLDLILTT